jgi:RNA polymerase sigma factor (sigma-70 family)
MNIFDKFLYLQEIIEDDMAEINRLRQLATEISGVDPSKEFVSGGFVSDARYTGLINKALDLAAELEEQVEKKLEYEREIYKLLEELNPLDALVLRRFYIQRQTIREIAYALRKSERRIQDIKSNAIKKCEKLRFISL